MANQYNALIEIQTSLDCDDFNEPSVEELLALTSTTIEEAIQKKIETLPVNVREIVVVTVVGIRLVIIQ